MNKTNFKDRKELSGSLFQQIDEVYAYLNVFNRVRSTFEGVYRVDHPDYLEITIREAFVNSLIHRDYYIEKSSTKNEKRIGSFFSPAALPSELAFIKRLYNKRIL